MSKKVQVKDALGQVLFECSIEKLDLAFEKAKEYEEMGIDIKIDAPSLPESLGLALGMSSEDQAILKKELQDEVDDHGTECCPSPASVTDTLQ